MAAIDLSIIILNYNTSRLLQRCLESIRASRLEDKTAEVLVVDNASADDSVAIVKALTKSYLLPITVFVNEKNLGFAAGNNRGIHKAKGRYILLLNSDTEVTPDTLLNQITFMDTHPEFAASTCKEELTDGTLDPRCHRGFPTPWASFCYFLKLERLMPKSKLFSGYHQGWQDLTKVHAVEVASGAFFFVRKEVFDTVGLLDEDYFMYAEDIDICLRMANEGLKIGFNPGTSITHFKGLSGRNTKKALSRKQTNIYFWSTMKQFYQKHYQNRYPGFIRWLVFKILDRKVASYE